MPSYGTFMLHTEVGCIERELSMYRPNILEVISGKNYRLGMKEGRKQGKWGIKKEGTQALVTFPFFRQI